MKNKRSFGISGKLLIIAMLILAAIFLLNIAQLNNGYIWRSRWIFGNKPKIQLTNYSGNERSVKYPDVGFAVLSDIHYFDKSMGVEGTAFERKLNSDRKMLKYCEELLDTAIDELLQSDVSFVLVSGDLTKDGEKTNHEILSEKLDVLIQNGIKVYVVPGNHDVNNYGAERFEGDNAYAAESVNHGEFAEIYSRLGYAGALMRDEASLSYVAEPVTGLWILALDACRSYENKAGKGSEVAGRIKSDTADWITEVLNSAAEQGKAVITLMHHGIVEHWAGQSRMNPEYIVEDYPQIGEFLASYNVQVVFTGHYHAQDISLEVYNGKCLYDIQTGSLVTGLCPIRFCELRDGQLSVSTVSIAEKLGEDFAIKARDFLSTVIYDETCELLGSYMVSKKDSEYLASFAADAFIEHYYGDEDSSKKPVIDTKRLGLMGKIAFQTQKYMVDGLWTDLPPSDNDIIIDLN